MNATIIEQKKYKRLKMPFIFAVFYLLVGAITLITVKDSKFLTSSVTEGNRWLSVLDSVTVIKILFVPIMISTLTSRVVEIENSGNMWKMLYSLGIDKQSLFFSKFLLLFFKYTIYLIIEFIIVIILTKRTGLNEAFPYFRIGFMFITQLSISYMIMSFHYLLALKSSNQIINTFVSITGALVGIIGLFLPRWFSSLVPYSWMGTILNLKYSVIADGRFIVTLMPINPLPLLLSIVIGTGILIAASQYFNRRDLMDN